MTENSLIDASSCTKSKKLKQESLYFAEELRKENHNVFMEEYNVQWARKVL